MMTATVSSRNNVLEIDRAMSLFELRSEEFGQKTSTLSEQLSTLGRPGPGL